MHELSLAGSVLRIVEQAAERELFSRVRTLHLCIPKLACVELDAMRFALDSVAPGTLLEGAEVLIDEPASSATCLQCQALLQVTSHEAPCPVCGSWHVQVDRDAGLRVVELLVE